MKKFNHVIYFLLYVCYLILIYLKFFFLKIGTSSVVYPAAGYASILADRNIPVVEINIETTPSTSIAT
jgi:hypothetical protein